MIDVRLCSWTMMMMMMPPSLMMALSGGVHLALVATAYGFGDEVLSCT